MAVEYERTHTDIAPNRHVYVNITGPNEGINSVNEIASDQPGNYGEVGYVSADAS